MLPIPKGIGDKIIAGIGGAIALVGLGLTIAKAVMGQGIDLTGVIGAGSGAGLFLKGMEEFLGKSPVQGVADMEAGAKEVAASLPEAEKEVKAIEANPVPVVEAAIPPVIAYEVQKEEETKPSS